MTADDVVVSFRELKQRASDAEKHAAKLREHIYIMLSLLRQYREVQELRNSKSQIVLHVAIDRLEQLVFSTNSLELGNLVIHEIPKLCQKLYEEVQ